MNTMLEKKTTWWSEPMVWMIIALPFSAVVGGALTIWFAVNNADTLVTEEHVKEGFGVRLIVDRERKAAELGIGATLSAEPGRMVVSLEARTGALPKNLVLTLAHPSDPAMDMVVLLEPVGGNDYAAAFATIPPGKRHLELTPGDKTWRITGDWQAPFTGSTRLSSTQHLSTQP